PFRLPSGKSRVDAALPWGAVLPAEDDPAGIARVATTLQPLVGDVITEKSLGRPAIPIRVPVARNGVAVYVLTAMVRPDAFADLIQNQHIPPCWVSGACGGAMRLVAGVTGRAGGG